MKQVRVKAIWNSWHTIEVEDDFILPDNLDGFTEDQLDEITSDVAELVDWEFYL